MSTTPHHDTPGEIARLRRRTADLEAQLRQAHKQLAHEQERLAALSELKVAISEPAELQLTLDRIVEMVTRFMRLYAASIVLWDDAYGQFTAGSSTVPRQPQATTARRVRSEGGATRWIIDNARPLIVEDVADDPFGANKMLEEYGLNAYVGLPLMIDGQSIGVLYALSKVRRHFPPSELDFLHMAASQAAIALKNVRSHQQLQQAAAALRSERDFALQVVNTVGQGIFVLDGHGRIRLANPALAALLGVDRDALVGRALTAFLDTASTADEISPTQATSLEARLVRVNGRAIETLIVFSPPLRDGDVVGVVTDLSRQKRIQRNLERARELAEESASAKSSFLASMSHEIRTPLNAIIGTMALLLDTPLNEIQQEYARIAHSSGNMLLQIISDILDYSKIEAGRFELVHESFDLAALLSDALDIVAHPARQKGLTLSLELAPTLPTAVVGDRGRLQQVLVNLLGNAVKFTEEGGVRLLVTGEISSPTAVSLHIIVRDTGIGIPRDKQARLFQPFTQADASMSRRYGGTGLGLAICARLVEMMNGRIWLESTAGQGTSFFVDLSLDYEQAPGPAHEEPDEQPRPQTNGREPRKLRILLVEDNLVNQKVAIWMLNNLGYEADVAGNGRDALQKMHATRYDLVLMDIHMPEMDGLEATRRIQAEWPPAERPCLVAMTASALEEEIEAFSAAGMDAYLAKPILKDDLQRLLEQCQSDNTR